jgi:hypothetical protein
VCREKSRHAGFALHDRALERDLQILGVPLVRSMRENRLHLVWIRDQFRSSFGSPDAEATGENRDAPLTESETREMMIRSFPLSLPGTLESVPDIGHVWPFWRQNLVDFAPLLFQAGQ